MLFQYQIIFLNHLTFLPCKIACNLEISYLVHCALKNYRIVLKASFHTTESIWHHIVNHERKKGGTGNAKNLATTLKGLRHLILLTNLIKDRTMCVQIK